MKFLLEIRTAYYVAKYGTVSEAADKLGVHRATIIRHIDTLEAALGVKFFRRHSKGYSKTDAGESLLNMSEPIEREIDKLLGRIKFSSFAADHDCITVASEPAIKPLVLTALSYFQEHNPSFKVELKTIESVPKLELGEADIYLHVSRTNLQHPDYVCVRLGELRGGVYAHSSYVKQNGRPNGLSEFSEHRFALVNSDVESPQNDWIRGVVPPENVILTSDDKPLVFRAIADGLAIGCLPEFVAQSKPGVVPILAPIEEFAMPFWAVTHMDVHRTPKIQSFLKQLKERDPAIPRDLTNEASNAPLRPN